MQPKLPNYYELLGISFKSSIDEIKKAMQKHAQSQTIDLETLKGCKHHLCDANNRAQYDKQLLETYPYFKAQIVAQEREIAKKRRESREAIAMGQPDPHAPPKPKPKEKRGCLDFIFLIGTGIVLSVFFHSCSGGGGSGGGSSSRHSEGGASYACKEAVKAMMKAPTQATVSFDKFKVEGSTYTFFGTVDAPNSFGVMLRKSVVCTATHQSGAHYGTSVSLSE